MRFVGLSFGRVWCLHFLFDCAAGRYESFQDGRAVSQNDFLPFCGDIFRDYQMQDQKKREGVGFWAYNKPFDREYLENGKSSQSVTCKLELNTS